ncbi:MAG TPA: Xaa-Pro peptidase family protein [Actinomycetota bacterium]|nr:Xaa-Pro peptidase family protein [Actinomycetota bacterium]
MTVGDAVTVVDARALRAGRLARLQAAIAAGGADACVLFNPANVRYATGATTMTIYCLGSFVRCAVVAPTGEPVLFEHGNSMHLFADIEADVRPFHAWEFFDAPDAEAAIWARETAAALRELDVPAGGRVAVDKIAPVAHAALAAEGYTIVEAGTIVMDARAVKTPEEIALARANGHLVMDMLGAFEAAIVPGVRERDLVAVLSDVMLRGGGEYLITRGVASGPTTNPWRQEATDRPVAEGDLVFVDTDVNGIEGYFSCVSRTFICGGATPTAAQRATYAIARDWVLAMHELIRPGVGFRELAERAPQLPDRFRAQRYECVLHSCGLEDEGPSVSYADADQPNPDRTIEPGMVVVSEVYLGEVGGSFGVKLGDQLLVTADGIESLAPYPFDPRFAEG